MASDGNVFKFSGGHKGDRTSGGNHNGGGSGGGGSDVEARVTALEKTIQDVREKLVRVETNLEGLASQVATKADIAELATKNDLHGFVRASSKDIQDLAVSFQKSMNEQTWKFIALSFTMATFLTGISFWIGRLLK